MTDSNKFCRGCTYLLTAIVCILMIVCYTVYIITRAIEGAHFTKGDIVCAALLICFGTFILLVMLICLCLESKYCQKKATLKKVIDSRFKRVSHPKGDCSICLDEKSTVSRPVVIISCNHTFHKKCIKEWLSQKSPPSCPECRQPSEKFSMKSTMTDFLRNITTKNKTMKSDVTFV